MNNNFSLSCLFSSYRFYYILHSLVLKFSFDKLLKCNSIKFILFLVFEKFNTNFDFDSFRETIKLKADAVNKSQKVCGKKEEELKSAPKLCI